MASRAARSAQLIALDGTCHADLTKAARALRQRLAARRIKSGVSWWDASGVFFEVGLGKRKHRAASPRTLLLLYAADLAFRLRWEIRPALAEGQTVIAAPYLDTAFAFGDACGLSREWLASLFAFAPAADAHYVTKDHGKVRGRQTDGKEGFAEFAGAVVAKSRPTFIPAAARIGMIAFLEATARRRGSRMLT
jgi:thymidylate kinase